MKGCDGAELSAKPGLGARMPSSVCLFGVRGRADGGVRAPAVGLEPVDGLGHTTESQLVCRTHHRILSVRWCPRTRFLACCRNVVIHSSMTFSCG